MTGRAILPSIRQAPLEMGHGGLALTVRSTALSSLLPLSTKALIDFVIMKKGLERVDRLLTSLGLAFLVPHARQFVESIQRHPSASSFAVGPPSSSPSRCL